jgi:hypothetical protein
MGVTCERFNKRTVEASVWCLKCGGETMHRIDNGRRGPCLVCLKRPTTLRPPSVPETGNLFDVELHRIDNG